MSNNKVWTLPANEGWICDLMSQDFDTHNLDISTPDITKADIIWLLSDWRWRSVPWHLQKHGSKVVTTVHHIVPEKFGYREGDDFKCRDNITTAYHVFNQRTLDFIRPLTSKPITLIPYWVNDSRWQRMGTKVQLRSRYNIPQDAYVVGSFQRDTEGMGIENGVHLPKLEKGPDILADYLERLHTFLQTGDTSHGRVKFRNLHVVLAGWRRQYIISRLEAAGIAYTYIERPTTEVINELYQTLDLYPVTARHEGGPQSLLECGALGIPVKSRPVGIAEQVLPQHSISDDIWTAIASVPNVESMKISKGGFDKYREFFSNL